MGERESSPPSRTESPASISSEKDSENSELRYLPSSLANEELQLAINKEATEEELQKAITRCKELVLETDHFSSERKWVVRHLIELRLRLQEVKEAHVDPKHPYNKCGSVSNVTVLGHHFVLQPFLTLNSSLFCDHCTGSIWSVIQVWYKCEDCKYICHHKCLSGIIRECAHVIAAERGGYDFDICPEDGLSAQKYQCYECKTPFCMSDKWNEPRRCDYSGKYYCSACHWGCEAVIPARVSHNWDFTPMPVCQATLQLLKITSTKPLINLEKLNPKLFSLVHELNLVRRLRYELNKMMKHLLVCRFSSKDHFLWKNVDNPHLIEMPDLYSLQDLLDIHSGDLPTKLHELADTFLQHIKVDCELCKGRGFLCEICSNDEELFPFDESAHICDECGTLYHKKCFNRKNKECPKCKRLKARKSLNCEESITSD